MTCFGDGISWRSHFVFTFFSYVYPVFSEKKEVTNISTMAILVSLASLLNLVEPCMLFHGLCVYFGASTLLFEICNFVVNMKFQVVILLAFANVNILTVVVFWSMSQDDFAFICVFFYFFQFLIVITVLIFHFTD